MLKLTEQQKKEIIIKQCMNEPRPNLKFMNTTIVKYSGKKNGNEYINLYVPYIGCVYKNEIPDFGKEEINEVFYNDHYDIVRPSTDETYIPYVRYLPEYQCLEFSMIKDQIARYNRKINEDKRVPEFCFPNLWNGVHYNKVSAPASSWGWAWVKRVDLLYDENSKPVKRLFLFSDSSKIYNQNGNECWPGEQGKYYNKMFVRVLNNIYSKTRGSYGQHWAHIEAMDKFSQATKGENTYSFWNFSEFYRNYEDRALSKKELKAKETSEKPVKDIVGTTCATGNRAYYAVYEKVNEDNSVLRFFHRESRTDPTLVEFSRYYISKDGVKMFHVSINMRGETVITQNNYEYLTAKFFFDDKNLYFINKENEEAFKEDKFVGKYYSKFLECYGPYGKLNGWGWFENNTGYAVNAALNCYRKPLAKNMFKQGLYNFAYTYSALMENSDFCYMVNNFETSDVVSKRINIQEDFLQYMDEIVGRFNKTYDHTNLRFYLFHYIQYFFGDTKYTKAGIDKIVKFFEIFAKNTDKNKRLIDSLDVDARSYGFWRATKENYFEREYKRKPQIVESIGELLVKNEEYIDLYFKTVNNIRKINDKTSSSCYRYAYGTPGYTYTPCTYDLSTKVTMEKLRDIYHYSHNDAVNIYHIKHEELK